MSPRAIAGLFAFNLAILTAGAGVLWGIRGWRSWIDVVRLCGVAYLIGVSTLMILLTLEIVLGVPITALTFAADLLVLVVAGLMVGRIRGHEAPSLRQMVLRVPGLSLFAALFAAGIVLYLESLFRVARLGSIVREWDSWSFWIPKAEAIYWSERLDPELLSRLPQLPSYPPGLSALYAGVFHAMGSPDSATLHLQHWFLAVGFVAAVAGLLARRVHQAILFPILLLVLVAPSLVERMTAAYGDIPVAYQIALAALLVALWLDGRHSWHLVAAVPLLGGAMLTKREGILFAVCVLLAAFVASWRDRRTRWRWLALAGLAALALTLPWRIWFTVQGLPSDGPDAGYLGAFSHTERVGPSLKLVVATLVDGDLWPAVAGIAIAAIVLAALNGEWRMPVFASVYLAAVIAASTWAIWSNTNLEITQEDGGNPIVRVTSTPILALAALTPLLLERAWSLGPHSSEARPVPDGRVRDGIGWKSRWMWAIVLLALLSHPGAMLAGYSKSGLPGGMPGFPEDMRCVEKPISGEPVRAVLGYATTYPEAHAIRGRARAAGLENTMIARDGCGHLRVFLAGFATIADAAPVQRLARESGLEATFERDADG